MKSKLILFIFFMPLIVATCDVNQIDINSASLSELDKLTGIGPATAEKIISERPFDNLEELKTVKGIGEKKLADILDQGLACVEKDSSSQAPTTKAYQKQQTNAPEISSPELIESVINLNSPQDILIEAPSKEVYESKSEKTKKYVIYAFIVFLLFILGIVLFKE